MSIKDDMTDKEIAEELNKERKRIESLLLDRTFVIQAGSLRLEFPWTEAGVQFAEPFLGKKLMAYLLDSCGELGT